MWETCPLVHTNCTIAPGERFRLRDSVLRCAVGCESCGYMQLAAADAFRSFLCTRHRRPPPSTKMRTQSNPDGRAVSKSTNQPVSANSFLRAFCFALCSVANEAKNRTKQQKSTVRRRLSSRWLCCCRLIIASSPTSSPGICVYTKFLHFHVSPSDETTNILGKGWGPG